ncbi:uncharacterized protein LOC133554604 [Nerophis ophidion]|uniref:uncharacterized protein LOC133554604 n=1 Tax=Nerophis ophidion TaxID=159077 RepID=UPI002ADF3143|nr:uncharacterized protein LOC133554604 [Nerophis ophidion]
MSSGKMVAGAIGPTKWGLQKMGKCSEDTGKAQQLSSGWLQASTEAQQLSSGWLQASTEAQQLSSGWLQASTEAQQLSSGWLQASTEAQQLSSGWLQASTEAQQLSSTMATKRDMEELKRSNEELRKSVEFMAHQMEAMTMRSGVQGSVPRDQDLDSVERQVVKFLQEKGISLNEENIEACHRFPQKDKSKPATIIMRFANRKFKISLLRQSRMLKGSNVYLNEHLTKNNADIAKRARFLRKEGKIQATWSSNCKVYIKLNGAPEQAQVLMVTSLNDLEKFA